MTVTKWGYAARYAENVLEHLRPPLLPHQKPPEGEDWSLWLIEGGRGCVAPWTRIYDASNGLHRRVDQITEPVLVETLDGPAETDGSPFMKGWANMWTVTTEDGCSVTVTDQHRFLTPQGWCPLVDVHAGQLLAGGAPVPPQVSFDDPSESHVDDRRSSRRELSSQSYCQTCHGSDDLPPPPQTVSVQGAAPSRVDDPGRIQQQWHEGDPACVEGCSHACQQSGPLARSSYALNGPSVPASGHLAWPSPGAPIPGHDQVALLSHGRSNPGLRVPQVEPCRTCWTTADQGVVPRHGSPESLHQPLRAYGSQSGSSFRGTPLPDAESNRLGTDRTSAQRPHMNSIRWTRVRSVTYSHFGIFYDLTVPGPEHYAAEGLWNHNSGKTEACSRYFSAYMRRNRGCRARIIAPTKDDAIDACINGPSGLKSIDDQVQFHPSRAGGAVVEWPNGSIARVLGMDAPKDVDRLRAAGNRELDWWEEMAAIRHLENAWDQAKLGLRSGTRRHSIASTTPKATPGYRKIRSLPGTVIVKASMYDNPYLPQDFIDEIEALYANTRLGKQEVHGLLLEDVEGAYWSLELLETTRWNQPAPEWSLVVTAVDPSGSTAGDATGIVTVAADARGIPFVIGDDTTQGTPEHRYRTAVMAAYRHRASVILFEDTYGGDNIGSNLRSAWDAAVQRGDIPDGVVKPRIMPTSKLKPRLKGNKADRAGVIAALYEQHSQGTERVWHLPGLAKLEDEQTTWEAESDWSANRLDALAWGVRYHTRHIGRVSQPVDAEAALNSFAQGFGGGTSPFGNSGSLGRR